MSWLPGTWVQPLLVCVCVCVSQRRGVPWIVWRRRVIGLLDAETRWWMLSSETSHVTDSAKSDPRGFKQDVHGEEHSLGLGVRVSSDSFVTMTTSYLRNSICELRTNEAPLVLRRRDRAKRKMVYSYGLIEALQLMVLFHTDVEWRTGKHDELQPA